MSGCLGQEQFVQQGTTVVHPCSFAVLLMQNLVNCINLIVIVSSLDNRNNVMPSKTRPLSVHVLHLQHNDPLSNCPPSIAQALRSFSFKPTIVA